ncbi:MAG: hypothetical protein ACJ763_01020 [Bdellovibrionia bacterium]
MALISAAPAFAATRLIPNINRDLPLFFEDARPIGAGNLQFQAVARYERTHEGTDQYFLLPQVQYGFSPRGFAQLSTTEILGSEPKSGTSDLTLAGFYSLLPDLKAPFKLAFYTQLEFPTGPADSGLQNETGLFATQSLDDIEKNEIHLNLYWIHSTNPGENELRHRYRAIVGYNNDINEKWIFLADVVREQGPEWNQFSNTIEVGAIYASSEKQNFALGLGAGIGEQSQKFRATIGYQYQLGD